MTTLTVTGMNCQHCVRAVTQTLEAVPGVTRADVDLATGIARVGGEVDAAVLIAAVEAAGYGAKLG